MIWLQGVLGIIGGGSLVGTALFVVVMTDVTLESQRYGSLCTVSAVRCR